MMTVKKLKDAIADLPDDMVVMTGSLDHEYSPIYWADEITAIDDQKHCMVYEDAGQDLEQFEKRIKILMID